MHQMVIFSKRNDKKEISPKMAIYFFKPMSKVRINPVWFMDINAKNDEEENNYNLKNLYLIKDRFDNLVKPLKKGKNKVKSQSGKFGKI